MNLALRALAFIAALLPGIAAAQIPQFPQTLPANTVVGRLGSAGPAQAVPFATLLGQIQGVQSANTVQAGPTTGAANVPTFRLLVGADLPAPGASSFGGVQSKTCSSSNWFNTLSTAGVFGCSQPAFSDISGTVAAAQLPNPSSSTLGGVKSLAALSHQFLTSISTAGQPTQAQPACADVSDATVYCNAARGQLPGETSTGSASSGNVGEYIESVVASGSAVTLTTNTGVDVTTISLTAGDWDVSANVSFLLGSTTSITLINGSISQTLNTIDTTNGRQALMAMAAFVPTAGTDFAIPIQSVRFSLSGTTTIHLVAFSTFTVSTNKAYGIIRARRVR